MADISALRSYFRLHPADWISPARLRARFPDLPDRTLRRWTAELVAEGLVERTGTFKGTRYRLRSPANITEVQAYEVREPVAPFAPPDTQVFSPASLEVLRRVDAPIYTRPPVTYAQNRLDHYIPNHTSYLTSAQRESLRSLGQRAPIYGHAGTYVRRIYDRLLIDLSYNSSRLEGNTYSLADTASLVIQGVAAPGKPNAERIMILNHKEAIRYLAQHIETLTVSEETVRTLHYLLADSLVAPGFAGQIREEGVMVSGTTYAPLEGRARLTRLLVKLVDKARAIADPFEQSFFLLGHVSYLQPFIDVNKRTARLASIIPLITQDFVPQSFVDADKTDYLRATVAFYEFNEAGPLADLYCWSYERTCRHFDTSVQVVGFDEIAALYRPQRRALVGEIVRAMIPLANAAAFVETRLDEIEPQHRQKFLSDVLAELENLDAARIAGLGITRAELDRWRALRGQGT
jgi:fido (protein-threonine AMPylation protein)